MDKNKINYKPIIKPNRSYYSEATFVDDFISKETTSSVIGVSKNDLENKIQDLKQLDQYIPYELREGYFEMLNSFSNILENMDGKYDDNFIFDNVIISKPDKDTDYDLEDDKEFEPDLTDYPDEWIKDKPEPEDPIYPNDNYDPDYDYPEDDFSDEPQDKDEDTPSDNYRDDYDFVLDDYDPDISVIIKEKEKDLKRFEKEFNLHLSQIINDYIIKLNKIMTEYLIRTLSVLDKNVIEGLKYLLREYTYSTTDISNKDLQHLSDTIIKEQIINSQNYKLFNKLFNKKELQKHLRFCKASSLQKERYYNIDFDDKGDIKSLIKNYNLEEQRLKADSSYKESFRNLYKFLNSQSECLDDILKGTSKEITSKAILVKEEGIKLETSVDRFVNEYNKTLDKLDKKRKEREAKLQQRNKERKEKEDIIEKAREEQRQAEYEKRKKEIEEKTPFLANAQSTESGGGGHSPASGNKEVPNTNTSFKSYMDYKAITYKGSVQYKIRQSSKSYTDSAGLRRVMIGNTPNEKTDDYQVAMTSYYGKPGDRLKVTLENGFTYTLTISDQKKSSETDSKNMYHKRDGSVTEFLVDTKALHPNIRKLGSVSGAKYSWSTGNEFKGNIKAIEALGENKFV